MWRKRRAPAPGFKIPAPFNPITGQHAQIGSHGILSVCAIVQVIEEDTHDNYVVCRGFDPADGRFYNTINVAKPYSVRGTKPYKVAEVYPAIKALGKLGFSPGVAATTTGQPADLDEEVEILKNETAEGEEGENVISWLLLDTSHDLSYTQIVDVTNMTEEDWGLYDIVGVAGVQDTPITDGPGWFSGMSFNGYRLDAGAYAANVGVTQESIEAGKTGRVCIRGVTLALVCKYHAAYQSWLSKWVHVWKASGDPSRWMFYRGPAGDARILAPIAYDYTDDQHLVLIDLCEVPNRVLMMNNTGDSLAPHSYCVGDDIELDSLPDDWVPERDGHPFNAAAGNNQYQGYITPGYSIPDDGWAYCWRVTEGCPVCVERKTGIPEDDGAILIYGPAVGQTNLWHGLPGFCLIGYQPYYSGASPYSADAAPPAYGWFLPRPDIPFLVKAHASLVPSSNSLAGLMGSSYVNVCLRGSSGTIYIYDGTTQGGVEFPVVASPIHFGCAPFGSGGYVARWPNVQEDQYFHAVFGKYGYYFSPADGSVWDDPIGTVKMWTGETSAIPPGWRQYSAMSSRVPRGANSTGTGTLTGASGTGFDVDYASIIFIERYQ